MACWYCRYAPYVARSLQFDLKLVGLLSTLFGTLVGIRLWWSHPDVHMLTSLGFILDIDRLLQGRYLEVTWFEIGNGHAENLYRYFHFVNARFLGYDARLEVIPVLFAHGLTALSIFVLARRFIAPLPSKLRILIAVLLPTFVFSFVAMGSRGMEFGTFVGIAVSLGIWAVASSSRGSRTIWIGLLCLQVLVVFLALGGYALGLSATLMLASVLSLTLNRANCKLSTHLVSHLTSSRLYQYTITVVSGYLAYAASVFLFSSPSSGIKASLSPLGLIKYVIYGNAGGLVNVSVLERWGGNAIQPRPFTIGLLMTALYVTLSILYARRYGATAASFIALLWYGTMVSISVYPFRPFSDAQMLNTWYGFHHKVSLAAAVVGILVVPRGSVRRFFRPLPIRSVTLGLLALLLAQANVIMWYRHPHERAWFEAKQLATLGIEDLTVDPATGLTQLLVDLPYSLRAIEIQRRHRLSIFRDTEAAEQLQSPSVAGVEPDGWLLQDLLVRQPNGQSCKLEIDIVSLLGHQVGADEKLSVVDAAGNEIEQFALRTSELPTRFELRVVGRAVLRFSNRASATELEPDTRPLSARGFVICRIDR